MADIPHFALPLRIVDGHLATVEQDSVADITQCVRVVLTTPEGSRIDLPEFGLPDPVFGPGGVDVEEIEAAIAEWEPRAEVDARADDARLAEGIAQVIAEIGAA